MASNAAGYLGVNPAELAFTDSTTMGLALTYRGLISPGDEVVTTEHDHYATHESLRLAGARCGACASTTTRRRRARTR